MPRRRMNLLGLLLLAALLLLTATGCALSDLLGRQPPSPTPTFTKTPKPTFTATPEGQPPLVVTSAPPPTNTPVVPTVVDTPTPVPTDTPVPPTPTPVPPEAVISVDALNVRAGPGVAYDRIAQAQSGERYQVVGRTGDGSWLQLCCFEGRNGWVAAQYVRLEGAVDQVALVTDLPPTPTPRPTQPPTATPVPATATLVPATPTSVSPYEYKKALVQGCEPNPGVTTIRGTVYRNHQPYNGAKVVFSWSPDGKWATQPAISGPHSGYSDWANGFYEHIIQSGSAREGTWYVWIVNDAGTRISEMAVVHTDGTAGPGKCQKAVVDFDTN